jgi:hypothetical protein
VARPAKLTRERRARQAAIDAQRRIARAVAAYETHHAESIDTKRAEMALFDALPAEVREAMNRCPFATTPSRIERLIEDVGAGPIEKLVSHPRVRELIDRHGAREAARMLERGEIAPGKRSRKI